MPGSTTLNLHPSVATIDRTDAERLLIVVNELARLTANTPDRLSDPQVAALCEGTAMAGRADLTAWLSDLAATMTEQLHHGLGHA